jgi:TP901 family phage tail tape measure protein
MGDQKDVARAATAVMQAYGVENMGAAKSVDVLTAIVKEGNLEASELAPSIGKVIPIAKALGVSFEEVGANIAVFTRLGVSASESVNALKATLAAILKPTKEAKEELATYGLTFDDLRNKLRSDGLMAVLNQLTALTNGNVESMGRMIGSVEGLADVLGTSGAQAESYAQVLASIHNATGLVDRGFQTASQGSAFKFQQTMNALKNAAITLGEAMIPVFEKIAGVVRQLADGFRSMSNEQREMLIKITAITAASPILLTALSSLTGVFSAVASASVVMVRALGKIALAVGAGNPITIGLLIMGAAVAATIVYWDEFKQAVERISTSFTEWFNTTQWVRDGLLGITYAFQVISRVGETVVRDLIAQIQQLGAAISLAKAGFGGASMEVLGSLGKNSSRRWTEMVEGIKQDWVDLSMFWNTVQLEPITAEDVQGIADRMKQPFVELKNLINNIFSGGSVIDSIEQGLSNVSVATQQLTMDTAQFGVISDQALKGMRANITMIDDSMQEMRDRWTKIWSEMGQATEMAISNMMGDLITGFTSAMTGLNSMEDVFRNIGNQLANLLEMLGKTAIYKGLIEGKLATLFSGNPAATIGIGIAALAAAGVLRGAANNGGGIPAFANGALVTGPMLAMVGDNKNAARDPEAILPVSKLQGYIAQAMGTGGGSQLYGRLSGNDILITNDRNANRVKRITGR